MTLKKTDTLNMEFRSLKFKKLLCRRLQSYAMEVKNDIVESIYGEE